MFKGKSHKAAPEMIRHIFKLPLECGSFLFKLSESPFYFVFATVGAPASLGMEITIKWHCFKSETKAHLSLNCISSCLSVVTGSEGLLCQLQSLFAALAAVVMPLTWNSLGSQAREGGPGSQRRAHSTDQGLFTVGETEATSDLIGMV